MQKPSSNRKESSMYYSTTYSSPVGVLTLASDGEALCGIWLEGQKYHCASIPGELIPNDDAKPFSQTKSWLDDYFAGKNPSPKTIPLAPIGSEFRQAVWEKLLDIKYGDISTYGEIASAIKVERGKASALAVGGAVGHNPISIIIPCHRVVGADGSLTGYAGGLSRKIQLLELENVDMSNLYIPKKGTAL